MVALYLLFLAAIVVLIVLITKIAEITTRLRSLEERLARISEVFSESVQHARADAQEAPSQAAAEPQQYAPPETIHAPATPVRPAATVQPTAPPKAVFMPPPPPSPSRTREEWEALIGGKLLNRIGALALVIGIGFFLKYAFDNNWLSETVRVLIGAAAGILLLAGAARSQSRGLQIFAQGLVGAGIAVLYLSAYASFNYYQLVSQPVAFVLMALVTIAAFTQAFRYDSIAVSLLGWAGGYLTPFMLSTGETNAFGLFSYLALLAAGLLVVVTKKDRWAILEPLSLAATYFIYFLWYNQEYHPEQLGLALFFAWLFWALFFAADMVRCLRRVDVLRDLRIGAALLNVALFFLALFLLIYHDQTAWMGGTTLALGVVYFGAALAVRRVHADEAGDFVRLTSTSVVFFILAPAIEFEGFAIIAWWAGEALALAWAARRWKWVFAEVLSYVLYLLALFTLMVTEGALFHLSAEPPHLLILNWRVATFLLLAASMALAGSILGKAPASREPAHKPAVPPGTSLVLHYGWCFLLFILVSVETSDYFRSVMVDAANDALQTLSYQRSLAQIVAWTSLAVAFALAGKRLRLTPPLYSSILVMFVALLLAAIRGAVFAPLSHFTPLFNNRALAVLLVIAGAFIMTRMLSGSGPARGITQGTSLIRILSVVLILILLSGETRDFFQQRISSLGRAASGTATDRTALENMKQLSLSSVWLLYSICLMGIGIWRQSRSLRVISIVVFGITILKIFIYDLSFLETLYRIFSFIGLGVVLLLVSYLYQHNKELIFHDQPKEEAEAEKTTT